MSDWNEQAAPNNNLPAKSIRSSKFTLNKQNKYRNNSARNVHDNQK